MRKISIAASILHKATADLDKVCAMYKANGIDGVDFGFDCYTTGNGHRDKFFSSQTIDVGYNKEGGRYIPVFGIDATEGAKAKISSGAMTGTVKQDGKLMAETIARVAENLLLGREALSGIDEKMIAGKQRVNIPYSAYESEKKS